MFEQVILGKVWVLADCVPDSVPGNVYLPGNVNVPGNVGLLDNVSVPDNFNNWKCLFTRQC